MQRFSMNEFQPLDLMEKQQRLEDKILEIKNNKQSFVSRKQQIEFELSEYNSKIRIGELENGEYREICRKQNALKTEKVGVEKKLSEFKEQERKISSEKDNIKLQLKRIPDGAAKEKILEIRDKYMSFAADTTRVSSMRAMASRFVEELQIILTKMN